jgi:glycosyltransferase involved in cell wall biosynthesis
VKKILIITNMYPSKRYPHYGIFVKHTTEVLQSVGNKVDVSCIGKKKGKISKVCAYLIFYLSTVCKIMFGNYDILYLHYVSHTAFPVLLTAKFKRVHIVANVHGNDVIAETKSDEKYFGMVRKLLAKASCVICPSSYFQESVMNNFSVSRNRTIVYPSGGVDTDFFIDMDRQDALKHFDLDSGKTYIGYVSRIEVNKGWDIFVKAGKRLISEDDNIRLIVVGDGAQTKEYERLIDELDIKEYVYKYDLLPQSEIRYIYNLLDVFVFPTYRRSESLGLVGLEAMSCKAITVLPDKYGPTSYGVDNLNSFVFNSGDAESLVRAIKRALNSDEKKSIAENARNTAIQYNHQNTDDVLVSCFSKL